MRTRVQSGTRVRFFCEDGRIRHIENRNGKNLILEILSGEGSVIKNAYIEYAYGFLAFFYAAYA